MHRKICASDYWLFRGQREDWPMIPKLGRLRVRQSFLIDEGNMIRELRRQVGKYTRIAPTNDWELLCIAQHPGMATRLLEWTLSPLIALWFVKQVDGYEGIAWDDYYLYGPDATWETIPAPLVGLGGTIIDEREKLEMEVAALIGK